MISQSFDSGQPRGEKIEFRRAPPDHVDFQSSSYPSIASSFSLDMHAFVLPYLILSLISLILSVFCSSSSISEPSIFPLLSPSASLVSLVILHELPFSGTTRSRLKPAGTRRFFQWFLRGFFLVFNSGRTWKSENDGMMEK